MKEEEPNFTLKLALNPTPKYTTHGVLTNLPAGINSTRTDVDNVRPRLNDILAFMGPASKIKKTRKLTKKWEFSIFL